MNRTLERLLLLRRVFTHAREGKGLATALVETFRAGDSESREVARRILLGFRVRDALEPISGGKSREISVLAGLLAGSPASSAQVVGRKGERLSMMFERWLKLKETRVMEQRVMQMRGHLMAAVMGAVVAMLASLGPLVSGLTFSQAPQSTGAGTLLLWSGILVGTSSATLGIFMSGKRFYVDVLVAMAAFALSAAAVAPLASVPVVGLWAIK